MRKIILSMFILVILFFINTAVVNACSCGSPGQPKEALEKSNAVFAGKVAEIKTLGGAEGSNAYSLKVTFDVSKFWKGPDYKNLVVITSIADSFCGYSFKKGEEYLVYTYGKGYELITGLCTRTKLLSSAQEDLKELGEGKLPTMSGSNDMPRTSNFVQLLVIIGGLIVLTVIIILVFRKHNK